MLWRLSEAGRRFTIGLEGISLCRPLTAEDTMHEHVSDAYAFLAVMCLPVVVWIISRPPLWSRLRPCLEPVASRLWQQIIEPQPPDPEILRSWAAVRLEQLKGHLERVRRLILDDEWMTATRQVANRMAHGHLVRDVREAEAVLESFGPLEPAIPVAAQTSLAASRFAYSAPAARPVVEVIEFGPGGR